MTHDYGWQPLREVMKETGWTIKALAEEVGVSTVAVYHWRRGTRRPALLNVVLIADVLGVAPHELFNWVDPPAETEGPAM